VNNAIRIFLRFVYEKVAKIFNIPVSIPKFSPFIPKTGMKVKKLIDRILLFIKNWGYFYFYIEFLIKNREICLQKRFTGSEEKCYVRW